MVLSRISRLLTLERSVYPGVTVYQPFSPVFLSISADDSGDENGGRFRENPTRNPLSSPFSLTDPPDPHGTPSCAGVMSAVALAKEEA